jgi:hypothetical protein
VNDLALTSSGSISEGEPDGQMSSVFSDEQAFERRFRFKAESSGWIQLDSKSVLLKVASIAQIQPSEVQEADRMMVALREFEGATIYVSDGKKHWVSNAVMTRFVASGSQNLSLIKKDFLPLTSRLL